MRFAAPSFCEARMTELTVAGVDRRHCEEVATRLRGIARRAALPVRVHVTSDAIDVQRTGRLGACTVLADGEVIARDPMPADAELEMRLLTYDESTAPNELDITA
jgi:hypothetical protein